MKKTAIFLLSVIILLSVSGCGNTDRNSHSEKTGKQPEQSAENMAESLETDYADNHGNHESPGLNLSELSIKISSDEKEAVFQLYDTKAAEKLYEQLPLVLDTENFRNAQWMFYPPESLPVTADEAYHDGIKGELSYYEPWGDVVMFYKEFGSYNGLYELGQVISGGEYIESIPEGTYIFEK